ncbi:MAG: 50S ribosomal protein L11 methyltransferase [Acidobacteriota bacterium]|nr:50S ribosomal protein L11 methyltransferase [Acidobacteriota bacterium]
MKSYPALVVRPAMPTEEFGDLVAAVLDDFHLLAIEEIEEGTAVRTFFANAGHRASAQAEVLRRFDGASVESADVSDEDWAARSQASITAVRVGGLIVAPPWDAAGQNGARVIVIQPSTGFGTGHHATTRLCLGALQRSDVAGKSVIDLGTGSGVLAIAAAMLGASRAIGLDNDQDAIDNALENRDLNAMPDVDFRCAGLEVPAGEGPFDVVLANLTGGVLIRFAAAITAFGAGGGRLILSGLREEEESGVLAAFNRPLAARDVEDGWVCLVVQTGPAITRTGL